MPFFYQKVFFSQWIGGVGGNNFIKIWRKKVFFSLLKKSFERKIRWKNFKEGWKIFKFFFGGCKFMIFWKTIFLQNLQNSDRLRIFFLFANLVPNGFWFFSLCWKNLSYLQFGVARKFSACSNPGLSPIKIFSAQIYA